MSPATDVHITFWAIAYGSVTIPYRKDSLTLPSKKNEAGRSVKTHLTCTSRRIFFTTHRAWSPWNLGTFYFQLELHPQLALKSNELVIFVYVLVYCIRQFYNKTKI